MSKVYTLKPHASTHHSAQTEAILTGVLKGLTAIGDRVRTAFCQNDSDIGLFRLKEPKTDERSNPLVQMDGLSTWNWLELFATKERRTLKQWQEMQKWLRNIDEGERTANVQLYEPRLFIAEEIERIGTNYQKSGRVWHSQAESIVDQSIRYYLQDAVSCGFEIEFYDESRRGFLLEPDHSKGNLTFLLVDAAHPHPRGRARDVIGIAVIEYTGPSGVEWGKLNYFCSSMFRRVASISQTSFLMANVLNLFLLRSYDDTTSLTHRSAPAKALNLWLHDASGLPGFYKSYGFTENPEWPNPKDPEVLSFFKKSVALEKFRGKLEDTLKKVWPRALTSKLTSKQGSPAPKRASAALGAYSLPQLEVRQACPPLSALIGFPVRLRDGTEFSDTICRSQKDTGTGLACVYWAFLNAYEALSRGLEAEPLHDLLPRSWREWYRSNVKDKCEGTFIPTAISALRDARIGYGPSMPGCWFHPPVQGCCYFETTPKEWAPWSDTHQRVHYSPAAFLRTFGVYVKENPLPENRLNPPRKKPRPQLGVDYVVVVTLYNMAIRVTNLLLRDNAGNPDTHENTTIRLKKWQATKTQEGIMVVPSDKPSVDVGVGINARDGHAMIVYGVTAEFSGVTTEFKELLLWDTASDIPQKMNGHATMTELKTQSCRRRLLLSDIHANDDTKVKILHWAFVGLNATGQRKRKSVALLAKTPFDPDVIDMTTETPFDPDVIDMTGVVPKPPPAPDMMVLSSLFRERARA